MVELRAVQPGFPLYGSVDLQGGQTYSHALVEQHGVLVRPELLTTLGVHVGDRILIGVVPQLITDSVNPTVVNLLAHWRF